MGSEQKVECRMKSAEREAESPQSEKTAHTLQNDQVMAGMQLRAR